MLFLLPILHDSELNRGVIQDLVMHWLISERIIRDLQPKKQTAYRLAVESYGEVLEIIKQGERKRKRMK